MTLSAVPFLCQAAPSPEVLILDKSTPERFLLSNSQRETTIDIRNDLETLELQLNCSGDINLKKGKFSRTKGREVTFTLKNKKKATLTVPTSTEECVLKAGEKQIQLVKDEVAYPMLKKLNATIESCNYQAEGKAVSEKLFLTNAYPMMTCAHPAYDIEILEKSEDGLLTKMEVLLGYKPGIEFITNGNPYAELDFSKAPKLDAIFVSTLLYRRDFTGTVVGRLLKFHAERGTLVYIIGTGYMQDEKDKGLLKELAHVKNGNIRVQEFKYIDENRGIKTPYKYLTNYLRDMHVKLFVTLSSENASDNVIITGGRNIHDGFVFAEKPDFSKYPEIQQSPEGAYAYWNDLEIKIKSKELAESSFAHLLKLWNRKVKGQAADDISDLRKEVDADQVLNSENTMMRHIMSLPYNDDHALEKLYVEMIDKAQSSIMLASPYLRPTKAIMDAFKRAIERKVHITIQTRINLAGDTAAWLYEETNKAAINDLYQEVDLYEWTENSILHTKMMVIDEKLAFFGSVNLSRRSFIQDVESGYIIHDEKFVSKLVDIFAGYKKKSREINEKQKRKFWATIIVNLIQNQF